VVAHLLGILWHTIRHRENIVLGMIDGRKLGDPAQAIPSPHLAAGLAFVALSAGWAFLVVDGHQADQVTVLGVTLRLGEGEREGEHERENDHEREHHGDRHD